MEIAFFSESYLPARDGVASEVHGLARALQRLGHGVRVYAPNPTHGAPSDEVDVDGIRVVRPRSLPVPLYGQYRWALWPFSSLRGERIGQDVDVIHLHTPGIVGGAGFLAARHFSKPLVGTFHTNVHAMRQSFPSTLPVRLFFWAAWWFTLGTYYRCDVTTAPTPAAKAAIEREARKPFRRPIEVIPNGIEVDRFHPGIPSPDWRERCGLMDRPLVTYLGRLTVDKGVHRFLDAVKSVGKDRPVGAIIGGVGPEEANVRSRLRADPFLGRFVRFVGPIAEEEKAALLSQSSVFVLPSTSDTSSVAVLEAMACATPCLVPDRGGPADLVIDGSTGAKADVRDPLALARRLGGMLDAPDALASLGQAAREEVVRHASIDSTAHRFVGLYESLIAERRGSHVRAGSG